MKFASFVTPHGHATWGAASEGVLYDLGPTGAGLASSLRNAIADDVLNSAIDLANIDGIPEASAQFLPVIPEPSKILCIGVNYKSHREEANRQEAKAPTVFVRYADTLLGHDQPAVRPNVTEQFDYEGELAIIISKDAYKVSEADAWSFIAGMAVFNDFTARDWQRITTQWTPGKNFAKTGGFGPYFVPVSDVTDFEALTLETRLNGEVRQSASLADLIFSVSELVTYVTAFTPLRAGDVIVTGTPGGVGLFSNPPRLLVAGDTLEVEITGLGILRNTVAQESD